MPSLLFVCTGNICRSPMALTIFREKIFKSESNAAAWLIESAGTWAQEDTPAARNACQAMSERGLDLSRHQARIVTGEMLQKFNLILVMEPNHKEALCAEFPSAAKRIFLLSEMSGKKVTIEDPIGKSLSEYVKCAKEIEAWIDNGWTNILKLSQPF